MKRIFGVIIFILTVALLTGSFFLVKYFKIAKQTEEAIKSRIAKSVEEAESKKEKETASIYERKIADEAANPWKEYITEDVFGPIRFKFPKNWYSMVDKDMNVKEQLIFLADPDWIMKDKNTKGPFTALLIKIIDEKYEEELKDYQGKNRFGKTTYEISDFNLAGVSGSKLSGVNPDSGKRIVFAMIPYRDKTFYIGTEDRDRFENTYNEILGTLTLNK